MVANPYPDLKELADLLWEAELIADKYSQGGLLLIRTKDGWRAFLHNFQPDKLADIEKVLADYST